MLALTAAALAARPAAAGSYVVSACSPSGSPGLWQPVNTVPGGFTSDNLCGGPSVGPVDGGDRGGLYAEDILDSQAIVPDGSRAGWRFTAPAGTTISAISYYRYLSAHGDRHMSAGLYEADGTVLEQCGIEIALGSPISCEMPNRQVPLTFGGLHASGVFVGVMCHVVLPDTRCGAGRAPLHDVRAVMYSSRVTLSEESTPAVAEVGGPLWAAESVSGVVPVTFAATDPSGIKEQSVRSDAGATMVSASSGCDFTLARPCPQQPSGSLSVDTSRVSDGPHTFNLVVTDAADNSGVVTSPTVVVDNDGPPPPVSLTATATGGGSDAVSLEWRNPIDAPVPIAAAMVQLCETTCPAAVLVGSSGSAQVTAPGPGLYAIRLWLLDSRGRGGPHNAALAAVAVPPAGAVMAPLIRTKLAAVIVGRRLRVSATIAPTGRVRVTWRAESNTRTLGRGSRAVAVRDHKLNTSFLLNVRARNGTTRVAVRSGGHVVAHAVARRGPR